MVHLLFRYSCTIIHQSLFGQQYVSHSIPHQLDSALSKRFSPQLSCFGTEKSFLGRPSISDSISRRRGLKSSSQACLGVVLGVLPGYFGGLLLLLQWAYKHHPGSHVTDLSPQTNRIIIITVQYYIHTVYITVGEHLNYDKQNDYSNILYNSVYCTLYTKYYSVYTYIQYSRSVCCIILA